MNAAESTSPFRPATLPHRSPLRLLLGFFSSIWTGVALLAVLFVYCSIGSAGLWLPIGRFAGGDGTWVQYVIRQWPGMEMTEFEWFHWWPFKTLIGLICLTLIVATLRRIPFKPVNYGVWMIHAGIITLCLGSVLYFTLKVEGDAPVARRRVVAQVPGQDPVSVLAVPGNGVVAGTPDDPYQLSISSIDPQWEILSGPDAGKRAYSVNVMVQSKDRTFIRQLLAGYPQYTEDLVQSQEPGPPWARAKKTLGTATVDDRLQLDLAYAPQEWFYLSNDIAKSWAIYLRAVPDAGPPGPWVQRPIEGLPLYNDYVARLDDVWLGDSDAIDRPEPLALPVPAAEPDDPLGDIAIDVTSYLRYAMMDSRRRTGGDVFDPTVAVRLQAADGRSQDYQLVALDPVAGVEEGGRMAFVWVSDEADFQQLLDVRQPVLKISVPGAAVDLEAPVQSIAQADPDLAFAPIEGTGYSYRVQDLHDGLQLPTGQVISVAVVQVRTPDRSFVRWVSDDSSMTRDMPQQADPASGHAGVMELDPAIDIRYIPGKKPAPVTIVGGPADDQLRLVLAVGVEPPAAQPLAVGRAVDVSAGITLTVEQFAAYTTLQTRPMVVPMAQRDADARASLAMIQVAVPGPGGDQTHWLHFHHWPVESADEALGRLAYRPTEVLLADGRRIELMFSRQRRKLPSPVVLDDFVMDTHVGGFTGQNVSVLNWTSEIRFQTDNGWTDPMNVSVNSPVAYGGLSYFQAQWDPPDPSRGSAGLNFTVLGVGNRHGVNVMLLGCCVSVLGMIYAFYIKPVIRRRRLSAAYAQAAAAQEGRASRHPGLASEAPIGVGALSGAAEDRS